MKQCKKCNRLLDFSKFFKHPNVKDGYDNRCKDCFNARKREIGKRVKKRVSQKICSRCEKEREIDHFHKSCHSPDGHRTICKFCINVRQAMIRKGDTYRPSKNSQIRIRRKLRVMVKNEAFKQPTKTVKGLWDGQGRWSRIYEVCVECNTNIYKHASCGLCRVCYSSLSLSAKDKEEMEEMKKKWNDRYKNMTEQQKEQKNKGRRDRWNEETKILSKIEKGEIARTSVIDNLLDNYYGKTTK